MSADGLYSAEVGVTAGCMTNNFPDLSADGLYDAKVGVSSAKGLVIPGSPKDIFDRSPQDIALSKFFKTDRFAVLVIVVVVQRV